MKKQQILLIMLFSFSLFSQAKVSRVDPTNWFAGMENPTLQLLVYGEGIAAAEVSTDCEEAKVDSVIRLESPNYLLVYLDLQNAKPCTFNLLFKQNGKTEKRPYQLLQRRMSGEKRIGFSAKDVLYMLMPDRFASSGRMKKPIKTMRKYTVNRQEPSLRHGGDLAGLREHLDYFEDLGVTALWFTPVLENDSPDEGVFSTYHGYATTDYYKIDPRFGTNDEYTALIDDCHKRGLKVVMDMIFNHCGLYHPWLKDTPSKDWFNHPKEGEGEYKQTSYKLTPVLDPYASDIDKRETVDGWFVPTMPDLNQRNKHVMRYLIQNSKWWIETAGIDGIRMDTYPYADRSGMADWMREINQEYSNFNVVGETWVTEPAYTAAWQKDSRLVKENSYLNTVMDFAFFDRLNQAKAEETDDWWHGLNRIYNSLCYDYLYEKPENVMAFIENHDTDRFLGDGRDLAALKQALALLLTMKRIPQLYYGTEVLMNGTKQVTDGNVRKDFIGGFPGDERSCFTKEGRTEQEEEMFSWLKRLLTFRKGSKAITEGQQKQFIPVDGVYVLEREYGGKHVLTILNGTTKPKQVDIKRYKEVIKDNAAMRDVLTGRTVSLTENISLQPREVIVGEY